MPEDKLAPLNSGPLAPHSSRNGARPPSVIDLEQVDAFGQLRAVWDLLLKHQWLILVVTFVLTVLVAVYSYKVKPVYQATARVDVEAEEPLPHPLTTTASAASRPATADAPRARRFPRRRSLRGFAGMGAMAVTLA